MVSQGQSAAPQREKAVEQSGEARSLAIAERGIKTGADFASMMSSLMGDIIAGRVTPQVGNAACNAGGKLLRIVEMQYRYGTQGGSGQNERILHLVPPDKPVAP